MGTAKVDRWSYTGQFDYPPFVLGKPAQLESVHHLDDGFTGDFVVDRAIANAPVDKMFYVQRIYLDGEDLLKFEIDGFYLKEWRYLPERRMHGGCPIRIAARYTGFVPAPLKPLDEYLFAVAIYGERVMPRTEF